ncbi:neuronal acetylcholine receptor subunit alpha-10-like [Lytechinus variegatus]|uniref:neuronal acetylcholine receptor subunit alpha-10-like n=1 Tax=Lytechinus variegatus TaxID=7654 RepID=UPI001BB1CFB5|nr:neuronal acetylcholine receptor subunit alpha-10-like [Lytechinus variegatus]
MCPGEDDNLHRSETIFQQRHLLCHAGEGFSGEKNVTEKLLSDYGPISARPLRNSSKPIVVFFRALLRELISFDETNQVITLLIYVRLTWVDEYLRWDPAGYNRTLLMIPKNIWLPELTLDENVDRDFISSPSTYATATSDGTVNWYFPAVITTTCKVDVRFFPFDIQECTLTFLPWTMDESMMMLRFPDGEDATQDIYQRNGIWHPSSFSAKNVSISYICCEYPWSHVIYTLRLRRESRFFRETIILPSVLLTVLMATVSWLHPASGEKMTLAVSNLLALILFQQLVADSMPPIGDNTSIIVTFFFIMIALGCASVVFSVIVLRIYHNGGDKPLPRWIGNIIYRCSGCTLIFGRVRLQAALKAMMSEAPQVTFINQISLRSTPNSKPSQEPIPDVSHPEGKATKQKAENSQLPRGFLEKETIDSTYEKNATMWRETALVFDKIFGLVQFLVIIGACLYMLIGYVTADPSATI